MVTLAFGITDPDESVTVPRMVPLTDCAFTLAGEQAATRISATRTRRTPRGIEITRRNMCVLHGWGSPILLLRALIYHIRPTLISAITPICLRLTALSAGGERRGSIRPCERTPRAPDTASFPLHDTELSAASCCRSRWLPPGTLRRHPPAGTS